MYKSQNNEAEVVLEYFKGHIGTLLDIGANNGVDLSNSFDLIERGWSAVLVEPGQTAFDKLQYLYKHNHRVFTYNIAIGKTSGKQKLYSASDSLLTTTKLELLDKWEGVTHQEIEFAFYTFHDALDMFKWKLFDFITVDCEGMDWEILQQIDLNSIACKCICIEHNGDQAVHMKVKEYCARFGLTKELLFNGENTILAK